MKKKKSINLPNIKNFRIEAPFSLISDYEPSINHEVDHFAKTVLKLDENFKNIQIVKFFRFWPLLCQKQY